MANGKWQQWEEDRAQLERITNWAAKGCTDAEIAHNMGIRRETLYVWKKQHPNISNAIKRGRELSIEIIENTFFAKATGGIVVSEGIEEFTGEMRDGKPYNGTIKKRTVKRELPPDTAAMIFYLKNRAGYSDKKGPEISIQAPTIALGVEPVRADD